MTLAPKEILKDKLYPETFAKSSYNDGLIQNTTAKREAIRAQSLQYLES